MGATKIRRYSNKGPRAPIRIESSSNLKSGLRKASSLSTLSTWRMTNRRISATLRIPTLCTLTPWSAVLTTGKTNRRTVALDQMRLIIEIKISKVRRIEWVATMEQLLNTRG